MTPKAANIIRGAGWKKAVRYVRLYGIGRVVFKVSGRLRLLASLGRVLTRQSRRPDVAMIGCGQFAFATIGYFLTSRFGRRFGSCFDISAAAAQTFARFYGVAAPATSATTAIAAAGINYVYIASNHASHTPYAVAALQAGKQVYVEKPIAVSEEQLLQLVTALRAGRGQLYAGYNRPFSAAVRKLRQYCLGTGGPLTLSCFVSGHKLGPDHWYRDAAEGSRICGNVGHWLDLAVHMLHWSELPDSWTIGVAWSDAGARDDDLAISMTSARGDLLSIVLTARSEPFEGINETINFQWGDVIAKIDDFRRLEVWQSSRRRLHRYWPKDVGHGRAILQPFEAGGREWREVELSTLLMLRIARMVRDGEKLTSFSFSAEWQRLAGAAPH